MHFTLTEIIRLLIERDETLSVAESCTGGGLANVITSEPGVSEVFTGSVTAYANSAKEAVLHIPHDEILRHGAVSEEIAVVMAKNCRRVFATAWALSTTGIAGPTGGSEHKPVGLVYIGLAGPKDRNFAKKFFFPSCTRMAHREQTILNALSMLKDEIGRV